MGTQITFWFQSNLYKFKIYFYINFGFLYMTHYTNSCCCCCVIVIWCFGCGVAFSFVDERTVMPWQLNHTQSTRIWHGTRVRRNHKQNTTVYLFVFHSSVARAAACRFLDGVRCCVQAPRPRPCSPFSPLATPGARTTTRTIRTTATTTTRRRPCALSAPRSTCAGHYWSQYAPRG